MAKIRKIKEKELVGGNFFTEIYPVTHIKAVYDNENKTLEYILEYLNNELTLRIQGKSENSNASTDPFKYLGNFDSIEDLENVLNTMTEAGKGYVGIFRAVVSTRVITIVNNPISAGTGEYNQMIMGCLRIKDDGTLEQHGQNFNVLYRISYNGAWLKWNIANNKIIEGMHNTLKSSIDDEVVRAQSVEEELWKKIVDEVARAKAAESDNAKLISDLIGESPETLDTIHEISSWILNDATGAAAMAKEINENKNAIAEEAERAEKAEKNIADNLGVLIQDIEENKSSINNIKNQVARFDGNAFSATADEVKLTTTSVNISNQWTVSVPTATTEKAGIISAKDKENLNNSLSKALISLGLKNLYIEFLNNNKDFAQNLIIPSANEFNAGLMSINDYNYLYNLNSEKTISVEFVENGERIRFELEGIPYIPKGVKLEIVSDTITELLGFAEDGKEYILKNGVVTEDIIIILQNYDTIGEVTIKYKGALKETIEDLSKRIQGKSVYNNPLDDIVYLGNFNSYNELSKKLETLHSDDGGELWNYCGLFTATIDMSSRVFIMNSCTSFENDIWQQSIIGNVQVVGTENELDFYSHGMSTVYRYRIHGSWSEWRHIGDGIRTMTITPYENSIEIETETEHGNVEYYNIPSATTEKAGVMSANDKQNIVLLLNKVVELEKRIEQLTNKIKATLIDEYLSITGNASLINDKLAINDSYVTIIENTLNF